MNKSLTAIVVAVALLTLSGGGASAGLTMETPEDNEGVPQIDSQLALVEMLQSQSGDAALEPETAFDVARAAIAHRQSLAIESAGSASAISSMLDQQLRNLDLAQALLAETGSDASSRIGKAILATSWQVATLGLDEVPPVPLVGYEKPSEALSELASRHGLELNPGERDDLRSLDDLDEPVRAALARTVDAFLALESASGVAYANADFDELREVRKSILEQAQVMNGPDGLREITYDASFDDEGIALAGVDLAPVLSTRSQFLDAVDELQSVLANGIPVSAASCSPVQVAPAFSIDLETCDNTYSTDLALLIDAGGSDTYHNNAGGNGFNTLGDPCELIAFRAAAALVDLGSDDDAYGDPAAPRSCGANGGTDVGGVGFLYDAGGNDTYTAGEWSVNGGSYAGAGFLLDVAGNDTYTADGFAVNGGAVEGRGFLLDGAGDDTYTSPLGYGTNGGGYGQAVGFLLDDAGDDTYTSRSYGANGGAWGGAVSFLLDRAGNDTYTATDYGSTNGGSWGATGFLFDGAGDDTYTSPGFGANGGSIGGTGFLFDRSGDDTYTTGRIGANGGGQNNGVGFLLDLAGNDTYTATGPSANGGGNGAGVGLLFDGGGTDEYEDDLVSCTECSMVPKGTGAQVDAEL